MKTLEKDRSKRYATALQLADDVSRHLDDRPILAGPPRMVARLRKFTKRNSWPLLVATTAVALLLSVGLWYAYTSRAAAKQIVERSERTAEAIETALLALGQAINSPINGAAEWAAAETSIQRVKDLLADGTVSLDVKGRADDQDSAQCLFHRRALPPVVPTSLCFSGVRRTMCRTTLR